MTSSVTSFVQKFRKFKNSPKLHLWTDLHNSGCKWKILDDTTILYSLFTFFMPMTSYYDVIKSLKIKNRLWRHKIWHISKSKPYKNRRKRKSRRIDALSKYVFVYIFFVSEPNWMIDTSKWPSWGVDFRKKRIFVIRPIWQILWRHNRFLIFSDLMTS